MWKRRCILILVLVALLAGFARAGDMPDLTKNDCSIALDNLRGGSVTVYRVAFCAEEDGDLEFSYVDEFRSFQDRPLNQKNLDSEALARELWDYAQKNCKGTKVLSSGGKVNASGLSVGVYLIGQEDSQAAKGYYAINPFLVTIPVTVNGALQYHVDASPKVAAPSGSQPPTSPTPPPGTTPTPSITPKPGITPKPSTSPTPSTTPTPGTTPRPSSPASPTIPYTGQTQWPIPILAACGMILFVLGWRIRFGRGRQ